MATGAEPRSTGAPTGSGRGACKGHNGKIIPTDGGPGCNDREPASGWRDESSPANCPVNGALTQRPLSTADGATDPTAPAGDRATLSTGRIDTRAIADQPT